MASMITVNKHNMHKHEAALNLPKSWGVVYSGLPLEQQKQCPYASSPPSVLHSVGDALSEICLRVLQVHCTTVQRGRPAEGKQTGNTSHHKLM